MGDDVDAGDGDEGDGDDDDGDDGDGDDKLGNSEYARRRRVTSPISQTSARMLPSACPRTRKGIGGK